MKKWIRDIAGKVLEKILVNSIALLLTASLGSIGIYVLHLVSNLATLDKSVLTIQILLTIFAVILSVLIGWMVLARIRKAISGIQKDVATIHSKLTELATQTVIPAQQLDESPRPDFLDDYRFQPLKGMFFHKSTGLAHCPKCTAKKQYAPMQYDLDVPSWLCHTCGTYLEGHPPRPPARFFAALC